MHREGVKERLDYVADEGKRALMCFSPVRTLRQLAFFAPTVEPFATVGVSQALLDRFFADVLPKFRHPIVLVTSDYNSDRSAPKPFETDHSAMLDHPLVAHWFSDNWGGPPRHAKLTQVPLGLSMNCFQEGLSGDQILLRAVAEAMPLARDKPVRVLANFHHSEDQGWWDAPVSGGRPDRREALAALRNMTTGAGRSHKEEEAEEEEEEEEGLPIVFTESRGGTKECWQSHADFLFEISPQGNGLDCYRTWEALLLQTIPIVRSSTLDPLYDGLPVAIVDSWEDVTVERLAIWRRELLPLFETGEVARRLDHELWATRLWRMQQQHKAAAAAAAATAAAA